MTTNESHAHWARWTLALTAVIAAGLLIAWMLRGQPDKRITVSLTMRGHRTVVLNEGLLLYIKGEDEGGAIALTVVPQDAADSPQFCKKNLLHWEGRDYDENAFVAVSLMAPKLSNHHYPNPRHIPICGYPLEVIARVKNPKFKELAFAGGTLVLTIKHVATTMDRRNYLPTD